MQWKKRFTYPNYVLKCALTVSNEPNVWYYYCSRAGIYKPDGQGKHQMKTPGSFKIGCQCTAHLRV